MRLQEMNSFPNTYNSSGSVEEVMGFKKSILGQMRVFWLVLWPQMRWLRAQNWPHWSVLMYIHKLNSFPTAQKHLGWQRQAMASTDLQGAKWGPWRALRAPHMHFNEFVGVAHLEQGLFDPIPWRKTLETGRYCDLLKAPPSITSLTHCGRLEYTLLLYW